MEKKAKSKKGFTLVELMIVVAIIVVFTGIATLSIGSAISRSKNQASQASVHTGAIGQAEKNVRGILSGEPKAHVPETPTSTTSLKDSHHGSYDF